ncbi:hypothetical protein GBA52_017523 [Prunus armeniaca]|nr:hypothetical protein GBA52_017523 [Prunus armeniaca]
MMPLPSSTMTQMWATMGSTLASFMFVWAIIRQYCPYELRRFFEKYSHRIMGYFYPYIKISIHEFTGDRLKRSEAYSAVEAYLSNNTSKSAKRLKAEMVKDSSNLVLSMDEYERVTDDFQGAKVWWVLSKSVSPGRSMSMSYYPEQEKRFYKLTFHKKYRDIITESYLDHVVREGKEIRVKNRQRKLYTNKAKEEAAKKTAEEIKEIGAAKEEDDDDVQTQENKDVQVKSDLVGNANVSL